MSQGHVYKAVFLLAYFGFIRLSNLVTASPSTFDSTRHFLWDDVIYCEMDQSSTKYQVVQIPILSPSPLCPVSALKVLLASSPSSSSKPLFTLTYPNSQTLLTAPMITLSRLLSNMGLNPSHYGFHAFRKCAVFWAADHDVPLQNLQAHGGWSSLAIDTYLKHTPKPPQQ